MKRILIETARTHPADDGHIRAEGRNAGLDVSFTGTGFLRLDPTKFTLSFSDDRHRGRTLQRFDIDVSPAGLVVAGSFAVGDSGMMNPTDITLLTPAFPNPTLSIAFAPGAFRSDDQLSFGFRFNEASILLLGRNVSVLAGSRFRASFSDGSVVTGTLHDEQTHDWSIASGFGLIDARAAVGGLRARDD